MHIERGNQNREPSHADGDRIEPLVPAPVARQREDRQQAEAPHHHRLDVGVEPDHAQAEQSFSGDAEVAGDKRGEGRKKSEQPEARGRARALDALTGGMLAYRSRHTDPAP